jgi:hypothetical protein
VPPAVFLLTGSVQTMEGIPVEGIQVGFLGATESPEAHNRMPDLVVLTDTGGRFSLRAEGPGQVMVLEGATPPRIDVRSSLSDIVFQRGDSCALDVSVVDAEGRPAPNYRFRMSYSDSTLSGSLVMMSGGNFESDPSGQVRLDHAPCGSLQFTSAGNEQAPLENALVDSLLEKSVTLQLLPAISVQGVVVDSEGQPISDAVIIASWSLDKDSAPRPGGGRAFTSVTDDGQFELQIPPEVNVRIVASSQNVNSDMVHRTTPALEEGPLELELQIRAGRHIQAHCPNDEAGCGEPDAMLTCTWKPDDSEAWVTQWCTLSSDARSFDCPCGLESSEIRSETVFETAQVAADQSEVTLVPQRHPFDGAERRWVYGTVSLVPDGGPCAVSFAPARGASTRRRELGQCDANGQLALELPVGRALQVDVTQGDRSGRVMIDVDASPSTLPPIELDGTASLSVTVVSSSGEFLSGPMMTVSITSDDENPLMEKGYVRSAEGVFFHRLPAGTYTVVVFDFESTHHTTETVVVAEGGAHELEVEFEIGAKP